MRLILMLLNFQKHFKQQIIVKSVFLSNAKASLAQICCASCINCNEKEIKSYKHLQGSSSSKIKNVWQSNKHKMSILIEYE